VDAEAELGDAGFESDGCGFWGCDWPAAVDGAEVDAGAEELASAGVEDGEAGLALGEDELVSAGADVVAASFGGSAEGVLALAFARVFTQRGT